MLQKLLIVVIIAGALGLTTISAKEHTSQAQNPNKTDTINGEGHFFAHESDSLSFIKNQLTYHAFSDVFTKALTNLKLDSKLFWSKYNAKFENLINPKLESMKEKFENSNTVKKKSIVQINEFNQKMRKHKLKAATTFGKLQKAIRSYVIKRNSRSAHNPQSRYTRIEAQIDKKEVFNIYHHFTENRSLRKIDTLFITSKFKLVKGSWSDFAISNQGNFTNTITEHWKKWFEDNFSVSIENIKITDDDIIKELEKHAQRDLYSPNTPTVELIKNNYSNSLWLKININLNHVATQDILKTITYSFAGEYGLTDLMTNENIAYQEIQPQEYSYNTESPDQLKSSMATFSYQMPLNYLKKMGEIIKNLPSQISFQNVIVKNASSINKIFKLRKMLLDTTLNLKSKIDIKEYSSDKGILVIKYHGPFEVIKDSIFSIDQKNIDRNTVANVTSLNPPFVISLITKEKEVLSPQEQMNE